MLHKENLRHADGKQSLPKIFIPLLILWLIVVVGIGNLLKNRWDIPYTSYVVYLIFILTSLAIYHFIILDYQYSLIDNELMFKRFVGKREMVIIQVNLKDIIYFSPMIKTVIYPCKANKTIKILLNHSADIYVIFVRQNQQVVQILFEPSQALIKLICSQMPEK